MDFSAPNISQVSWLTDSQATGDLRRQARAGDEAALETVAKQFETLFVKMIFDGMRESKLADGLFDSSGAQVYQEMLHDEYAGTVAGKGGIGIGDMLVRQLSSQLGHRVEPPREPGALTHSDGEKGQVAKTAPVKASREPRESPDLDGTIAGFRAALRPFAEDAASRLGIDPDMLIAQAALETGWGRHVIQDGGGGSSHNLFGIKADGRWAGDRVAVKTLEYADGIARSERAAFRSYPDFAAGFQDYVDFVRGQSRYAAAVASAGDSKAYIRELHAAGYATDPAYGDKILDIYGRLKAQTALAASEASEANGGSA